MYTVAHIINPFNADPSSDLFTAQPITFESMRHSKDLAKKNLHVELYTAQFAEDRNMVPEGFMATKDLTRSVTDLAGFEKKIRLPLLEDILERLYTASNADYLIYTNVDIGLFPNFYKAVNDFIEQGHDAFIINRRRLPAIYKNKSDLELIYKEKGKAHPGFDCFVFRRAIYPKLKLNGICIGVPFVEISFSQNLFALSTHFKLFDNEHLTFHIGMEIFKKRAPQEYFHYNQKRFWQLSKTIDPPPNLKKFPYSRLPWPLRILRWAIHPCIPIKLVMQLEYKRIRKFFFGTFN
ncbi:hypothetical protein CNR22_04010 [Sphingobacteriaceae bacterium]|nr:hypothetical protein CNR22_04010 [Sphingobacteriaceae bacterium]